MTIRRRHVLQALAASPLVSIAPAFAQATGTLAEVKKRGTLRVGVTQAPPWYSKDPEVGRMGDRCRRFDG